MRVLLAVVASAGLLSCAQTWVDFRPYSATSEKRALTDEAVFAYEGDLELLRDVGFEPLGYIEADGNGFAERGDVRERALKEAAARGGTHVFIWSESASTRVAQVTDDQLKTTIQGNTAVSTYRPGLTIPVTTHHGSFVVVRVRAENWDELPRQLTPRPNAYAARRQREAPTNPRPEKKRPLRDSAAATRWHCQASEQDQRCFRDRDACDSTSVDCENESVAYCLAAVPIASGTETEPTLDCFATIEACRTARDLSFTAGARIINECSRSE